MTGGRACAAAASAMRKPAACGSPMVAATPAQNLANSRRFMPPMVDSVDGREWFPLARKSEAKSIFALQKAGVWTFFPGYYAFCAMLLCGLRTHFAVDQTERLNFLLHNVLGYCYSFAYLKKRELFRAKTRYCRMIPARSEPWRSGDVRYVT
jgi:hypothetical protein